MLFARLGLHRGTEPTCLRGCDLRGLDERELATDGQLLHLGMFPPRHAGLSQSEQGCVMGASRITAEMVPPGSFGMAQDAGGSMRTRSEPE